jgi:ABC-type nitrate/sulfonate/bicarbonate transport system permease component
VESLRRKTYGTLIISAVGFISAVTLLYITWTTKLSDNNLMRLLHTAPIIVGIPVGYLMYRYSKKSCEITTILQ